MALFDTKWTLQDIYSADQSRQMKASSCVASLEKVDREIVRKPIYDKWKSLFFRNKSTMNTLMVTFTINVSSDSGHAHKVIIKTQYDPSNLLYTRNEIQVYCDCADFKYSSAYILEHHGALYRSDLTDIKLGPSITTAPKRTRSTVLCKHAYAALGWFMSNYQYLMSHV